MQVFAKSDIGRERKTNEDFYYVSKPEDKIRLFILADGMGGYNAGEVASRMAVESAKDYIHKHFAKNKDSKEKLEALLKDAIEYANSVVYKKAQSKEDLRGMGTTLDVCLIYNSRIYIGHVGDSSVYTKTFIKDDIILMCSDGLTNMIREENIYEIIKQDKENAIENLVKQANDNGGLDNITVVIIM